MRFHVHQVALIDHRLVLGLVGLVGRTLRVEFLLMAVEQLLLLVVEQLLLKTLVYSWFNEIFGGGRGDMFTSSCQTPPVFNLTTFGIQ